MYTLERPRPLMAKMATPTSISVSVQAARAEDRDLVNIILHPITGDVGDQTASAIDAACPPAQRKCDLAHIGRITWRSADAAARGVGERINAQGSAIHDALLAGRRLRIIHISE